MPWPMWKLMRKELQMETTNSVLPATGYIRQKELVGCRATAKRPAQRGIIPFSATTLQRKIKDGEFPAPVRLSENVIAWRVEVIRRWMESKNMPEQAPE